MKIIIHKIFLFILLLLYSFNVHTQNKTIDSLKMILRKGKDDTNKVNAYANLLFNYQWSSPDSALAYSLAGLQLARKLNFVKGELRIMQSTGEALAIKGNFSRALATQFEALRLAENLGNHGEVLIAYTWIGAVYLYSEDYSNALIYFTKAKSVNYSFLQDPKFMLGFIGETYFYLNELDSAYRYIKKSYGLDVQSKTDHWSIPYYYLGKIYEERGDYDRAFEFYRINIQVSTETLEFLEAYNGIASTFKKNGQIDSALIYAKKVIENGSAFPSTIIEAGKLLTAIYKSKGLTDSAFKYQELSLTAKDSLFGQEKVKQMQNLSFNEQLRLQETEAAKLKFKNQLKVYGLLFVVFVFLLIAFLLQRNNRHKQKANALLTQQKEKVESTLSELKAMQAQLIQSEKMASLGEITAGIAHEIQNPLNFMNNFSEVNEELLVEMKEEIDKGNINEAKTIANNVIVNEEKINYHGKRADAIVKGMLQHSRESKGQKEPSDINALADEYLRLSYQGLRAKDKAFNATLNTNFDASIGKINIIPQDIGRVLLNLYNNAFYAVSEKNKHQPHGYEPNVSVTTTRVDGMVEIRVKDNGNGIPQKVVDKIFQPFFTTKPAGQGTGLGLSLSYDIIKAHGGEINVEAIEAEGAEFVIILPA
ncbi:MAG: ATP-binding protein [Chitinophagales bacterium]